MSKDCLNCGNEVSDQYAKVLGDNQDRVKGCPKCRPRTYPKGLDEEEAEKLRL